MGVAMTRGAKLAVLLCGLLAGIVGLSQVPNPPTAVTVATGTITVLVGGQPVGSAPVLNFRSGNSIVARCAPDPALNSIDCTSDVDSAGFVSPGVDQAFTNHIIQGASGSPTPTGKAYQAMLPTPAVNGDINTGSLWVMFPDATNLADASLDLGGTGPHPLEKLSAGAAVLTTGGECPAALPCILIAIGNPVSAFLIH